ncbi:uncharacterized protein LOC122948377 [Acropora millepora]|uniref:uncharacterized protein LOC122948377 n=1 Tax=Acropora millepora TaxID=45264 RepID=UPI001CF25385|nr:uncharacterized protein LOC122948377 [Acropora millepora]
MRSEIIEVVKDTAMKYVHFEAGTSLQKLMGDVVSSKSWHQVFGNSVVKDKNSDDTHFLGILSEEYKACKDKQVTKKISQNAKKQKEKFLIGNTKSQSRLTLEGKILDNVKSRTDAARKIGRVRSYGDEKRRLLSIVATDFPYRTLQQLFGCSPNTVTAARVHCLLFGRGGIPPPEFKFTRQCVSPEIIEELTEFLHRDNTARASSCRSVMVDGEETAVRYWQDSVKNIVQQYRLECPNGVKRTYVYTHLPRNFCMSTMLAGLCNLCDDFGHSNFDAMCSITHTVSQVETITVDCHCVVKSLRAYQTFLAKSSERHSTCKELCMSHAFGSCTEEHPDQCAEVTNFYDACKTVSSAIELCAPSLRVKLQEKLADTVSTHWEYVGHLLRTKHQADYYQYILKNLRPGEFVVVVDYKMKLELGKPTREIQRDWYGKRGISVHGFYVVAQVEVAERSAEVIDLWSDDIGFSWLESSFPGFRVYLFSDNGPHYHNTGLLLTWLKSINPST